MNKRSTYRPTPPQVYEAVIGAMQRDLGPDHTDQDPCDFADAAVGLLYRSFLKKATDTAQRLRETDLRASATSAFKAAEDRCAQSNNVIRRGPRSYGFDVERVLFIAQRKIGHLLNDVTYDELFDDCGHGPGVTRSISERELGVDTKYDETKISITSTALPIFRAVFARGIAWPVGRGFHDVYGPCSPISETQLIEADKVDFVPKSATSLRSIAIGPTGNVYLQLGIGRCLSKRLLRWGINLASQQTNSDLARWGSFSGALATLDLKSASDLLCTELVRTLLPPRLFWVMDACRSHQYILDGDRFPYHKFSGMGNGFTFPLQTLIFHAICLGCCEVLGVPSSFNATYGDDIIVPTDVAPFVITTLEALGLSVNDQKSFIAGPFRESCGGQYYFGRDIRPVYWKGFRAGVTAQEVCKMAHQLALWSDRLGTSRRRSLSHTLSCLKTIAFKLEPRLPLVPMNAPVGSGFPEPWCALDDITLRCYTFLPDSRTGRDPGLYADFLERRKAASGSRFATGSGKAGEIILQTITKRKQGQWRLRRQRLFLGWYPR